MHKLRSYAAAKREMMPCVVHCQDKYANNRAEVSHEHTREQEHQMRVFASSGRLATLLTTWGYLGKMGKGFLCGLYFLANELMAHIADVVPVLPVPVLASVVLQHRHDCESALAIKSYAVEKIGRLREQGAPIRIAAGACEGVLSNALATHCAHAGCWKNATDCCVPRQRRRKC